MQRDDYFDTKITCMGIWLHGDMVVGGYGCMGYGCLGIWLHGIWLPGDMVAWDMGKKLWSLKITYLLISFDLLVHRCP